MTEAQWPTPEEALAALDASGHLLEQQIATELEILGYRTQTNRAYTDIDEGKSRELDVYAYKSFLHLEARRVRVAIYLLIECNEDSRPASFPHSAPPTPAPASRGTGDNASFPRGAT